jgi:hypothetical protein
MDWVGMRLAIWLGRGNRAGKSGRFRARVCAASSLWDGGTAQWKFGKAGVGASRREFERRSSNSEKGAIDALHSWKIGCSLDGIARLGRRDRPLRKKIIGRASALSGGGRAVFGRCSWHSVNVGACRVRLLSLQHQHASEHRLGAFFQPLIQQSRNLLSQVGRMAAAGKLVALQRGARSGQQKSHCGCVRY